ncbi:hypothetical protein [Dyadobacter sp. CY323]|uniref:hypothetical protein n=1 Tax=Dyadobacter sp. CY323 TaxID=2907302 RepID=UPI001F190BF3|nr:hypothetical protein [Dyadobacter sp. CY323]MCE6991387.1 hypothetical protein [Dyadobacter sp. CY323]
MKLDIGRLIPYTFLLITISSVNQWMKFPIGNTVIWWSIYAIIISLFIAAKKNYYDSSNEKSIRFLLAFLVWNIICIARGLWVAENYWEWKNLVGVGMVLLLPFSIYISANPSLVQNIVSAWMKYALPAFFLMLPFFIAGDAIGRYLVPVSFMLLFFALLPLKWKIVMCVATVFVIFSALNARSNVIKFGISGILGLVYYFHRYIPMVVWKSARILFFVVPICFFSLAVSGSFNIFKISEYTGGEITARVSDQGAYVDENLAADTRTDIYQEVIFSAINHHYVWFGRTPARGNESKMFGDYALDVLKTGKMERYSNEVSILNIFTWTGVVGVCLYFLLFFSASYWAIYRSNSAIMKIVGLSVSFRWLYAWIEDFSEFDLSYLFLWVMIGMCFSKSFRAMDDLDFKYWIWGIFDRRYREIYAIQSPSIDTIPENKLTIE